MNKIRLAIENYIRQTTFSFEYSILMVPILLVLLPVGIAFDACISSGHHFLEAYIEVYSDFVMYFVIILLFLIMNYHRVYKRMKLQFLLNDKIDIVEKKNKFQEKYYKKFKKILNKNGQITRLKTEVYTQGRLQKSFNLYTEILNAINELK